MNVKLHIWHGAMGWLACAPSRGFAGSGPTRNHALHDARAQLKRGGGLDWGEQLIVVEGPPEEAVES